MFTYNVDNGMHMQRPACILCVHTNNDDCVSLSGQQGLRGLHHPITANLLKVSVP